MSQPPVFHDLEVIARRQETPELTHLAVRAPADFISAYQIPGQYAQIRHGEMKPGFFALASAPGQSQFEFLIKKGSPLADALVAVLPGQTLSISLPQGKGYPLAQAQGRDVFLVGVGSGLAPLRALLQQLLKDRANYKRLALLYGCRSANAFPYSTELDAWATQGVDVTRVCSQPAVGTWEGPVGRVQQILLSRKPAIAADSVVFACGMKPMVEDVKAAVAQLGVPPERVFQNF